MYSWSCNTAFGMWECAPKHFLWRPMDPQWGDQLPANENDSCWVLINGAASTQNQRIYLLEKLLHFEQLFLSICILHWRFRSSNKYRCLAMFLVIERWNVLLSGFFMSWKMIFRTVLSEVRLKAWYSVECHVLFLSIGTKSQYVSPTGSHLSFRRFIK